MNTSQLHYEAYHAKKEPDSKRLTEKIYDALKLLYNNENRKSTINELKEKDTLGAILTLEEMRFIIPRIDMIEIIKDSQYQRVKSYQLTPKGEDFIEEFDMYNSKFGFRNSEDIIDDFQTLLDIEKDKILSSETFKLRNKLSNIEERRKK